MTAKNTKSFKENQPVSDQMASDDSDEASVSNQLVRLADRFGRFAWDAGGVCTLAFALMTLLALYWPSVSGGILAWWANSLRVWLGWGGFWVSILLGIAGFWMLLRKETSAVSGILWGRVLAIEAVAFLSLAILAATGDISLERADLGLDGGRIGWGLSELLRLFFSAFGLSGSLWVMGLLVLLFIPCLFVVLGLDRLVLAADDKTQTELAWQPLPGANASPMLSEAPIGSEPAPPTGGQKKKKMMLPPEFRKNFRVEPEEEQNNAAILERDQRLPGFELLFSDQAYKPDEKNINLTAGLIEKTLSDFGIPAKVVGFRVGPTVTQFAVEPGFLEKEKPGNEGDINRQKVRVAQISSLSRDLALALSAERLRIEAPVPGRPYVGIEVPNARSAVVRLRAILESEAFSKVNSPLAIALGKDVSGLPVVADLGRMPHLLIAGTTGSGKSICIATLATCLVMNNTPEDLRLVMIDPKMVELVRFNGVPHLLGKVETDLERILTVLRWVVAEMDRRYKLLEASHSRNLETYNRKARRKKGERPLSRIVVLIDELADLMMSAPDQTEHSLVRLAQMARATGIHLVVATQRPSTDVVTGLIKANFPARISFAVASSIDSRVILDTVGAESLLGRGDMLFLPPDVSAPVRAQGALVTDQEIEKVITFWQQSAPETGDADAVPWEEMLQEEAVLSDRDGLLEQAIAIVKESQRANTSMLQRRLRIGYPRAARLIDELEELGVVGPSQGGGRDRDVLIDKDEQGFLEKEHPSA